MNQQDKATPGGISLYPIDRDIIARAMEQFNRKKFSDAVQFILRDWAKTNLKAEPEPESPTPQKHKA